MANALEQLIIERIEREGSLSFAEYMRMALYEPGYGYYVTGPARMGWEGDYYTSADVSLLFAHCAGRQLQRMWEKLGRPQHFVVLEQGSGRGELAREIQAWSQREAVDFGAALDYRVEDIRAGKDAVAGPDVLGDDVHTGEGQTAGRPQGSPLPYDESACEGVYGRGGACPRPGPHDRSDSAPPAVILSNELLDAFPVHIVEVREQRLWEVYVDVCEGRLCEVLVEPGSPQVASYLDEYKIPWHSFGDGWRAEINLDALRWMQSTARRLRRGYIVTIDYGDRARSLYTRYRRRGTLACYRQHQVSERPLAHPGQQDITAHVNFSALIDEGRRQGLRLHRLTTQRLWLEELGIYEELERRRREEFAEADTERASDRGQVALLRWYNLRQRVAALTDLAGMGNFKVLILWRN